jgi:hypothetical protein
LVIKTLYLGETLMGSVATQPDEKTTEQTGPKKLTREMICSDPKKHPLIRWFLMTEDEVLAKFATLPNAERIGKGEEQFVFVPGTREDRVLLVAHSDTVWKDKGVDVGYYNGHYFSLKKGVGIGADDRAGCAMLWSLRKMGHSLLIPSTEESGCKGSRFASKQKKWDDIINGHKFAIEFDRMNEFDMAFYGVGSDKFKDWCEAQFKPYKRVYGMHTDICVLCDPMCGMNISVGYYGQHSDGEFLVESEYERTLKLVEQVLSQKDLPRFEQDQTKFVSPSHWREEEGEFEGHNTYSRVNRATEAIIIPNRSFIGTTENILVCPWCDGVMDVGEWKNHDDKCIYCDKGMEG